MLCALTLVPLSNPPPRCATTCDRVSVYDESCMCFQCPGGRLCRCAACCGHCCHRVSLTKYWCAYTFGDKSVYKCRSFWGCCIVFWVILSKPLPCTQTLFNHATALVVLFTEASIYTFILLSIIVLGLFLVLLLLLCCVLCTVCVLLGGGRTR